jgi:hypothetical protein
MQVKNLVYGSVVSLINLLVLGDGRGTAGVSGGHRGPIGSKRLLGMQVFDTYHI